MVRAKKIYYFGADVVRVAAILSVVSIHVVNSVAARPDFWGGVTWWLANVWNSASRTSVPLFVMLSGALLIPKRREHEEVLARTWRRLVAPLVIWVGVYVAWSVVVEGNDLTVGWLLKGVYSTELYHFYFLFILMGLYLTLPVWQRLYVRLSGVRELVVGVGLLAMASLAVTMNFFGRLDVPVNIFTHWMLYSGYFVLGSVLAKLRPGRAPGYGLGALFLVGLVVTSWGGYVNLERIRQGEWVWQKGPGEIAFFDNFLSPNVAVMTFSAFVLLWQVKEKMVGRLKGVIQSMSGVAYGIYLNHLLVVYALERWWGFGVDFTQLPLPVFLVVKFSLVLGVSYGLTKLTQGLPVVRFAYGMASK